MISHHLAWHRGLIYCCQTWSDISADLGGRGAREGRKNGVSVTGRRAADAICLPFGGISQTHFWKLLQRREEGGGDVQAGFQRNERLQKKSLRLSASPGAPHRADNMATYIHLINTCTSSCVSRASRAGQEGILAGKINKNVWNCRRVCVCLHVFICHWLIQENSFCRVPCAM